MCIYGIHVFSVAVGQFSGFTSPSSIPLWSKGSQLVFTPKQGIRGNISLKGSHGLMIIKITHHFPVPTVQAWPLSCSAS
jgi:hypothetical protein